MTLVSPNLEYKNGFLSFYRDFVEHDPANADYYSAANRDFIGYVQGLLDESQSMNLKPNYVPCNHFWLIDSSGIVYGAIRVRHNLDSMFLQNEGGHIGYDIRPSSRKRGFGTYMLKLGLFEARNLGIDQVMITADEDNNASRKVIENNGGQFEKNVKCLEEDQVVARYWISL
nr:GNAT family N-acetyltransferase [Vibrio marisflavi]